ncbi:MAG TPA: SRPBCC family protein [Candidatus Dormibacteraeota bacterium]
MTTVRKTVELNVPITTAYNQYTQFESFPNFMEGVESVKQLDDKRLHWRVSIGGQEREWDAEIVEQVPDRVIAWHGTGGTLNDGRVEFEPLSDTTCRVTVTVEYDPQGLIETVGDKLGFVDGRVEGDLERFKRFVEEQGAATGAWRGEVKSGELRR